MAHHFDAGLLELAEAVARHQGVGVVVAAHHPFNTLLYNEVGAGRRLAVMRTRFQINI